MKLSAIVLFDESIEMPSPEKRLMARPLMMLPLLPAASLIPLAATPALVPLSSMSGVPANPGCVVASIVSCPTIDGNAERTTMECTPAPGTLKAISSVPAEPFASRIA